MPSPVKAVIDSVGMDFAEANTDLLRGLAITRRAWSDGRRVFFQAGFLHILVPDGCADEALKPGLHCLLLSEVDMSATDWVTVPRG